MKKGFVVIEGLDGSGKTTQMSLLKEYLEKNAVKYKYLHFPRMDAPVYGDLVSRFLRGELGAIDQVNPYLVALIYAGDRADAAKDIRQWLDEGYLVVLDRYVNSNIAFQCAKIPAGDNRLELAKWIYQLEYQYHNIPQPDISIFLDVPFEFTVSRLTSERTGDDRSYLAGKQDIHEADMDFQKKVREVYQMIPDLDKQYVMLNCSDNGKIKSINAIHNDIIHCIKNQGNISI